MNELKIEQEKGKEEFLGHLIYWCFRWGCEVRLTNKAWNHPVMQPEKDYWAAAWAAALDAALDAAWDAARDAQKNKLIEMIQSESVKLAEKKNA